MLRFNDELSRKAQAYPLHYAAYIGDLEKLNSLLTGNIDALDPELETALHVAIIHQREHCVDALIKAGADISLTKPKQLPGRVWIRESALDLASASKNQNIIALVEAAIKSQSSNTKKIKLT